MDGSFCKAPAQGTFIVEATVDGLFRLHPVAVQHTLSSENMFAYRTWGESTQAAYPPEHINTCKHSVNGDGARALFTAVTHFRPNAAYSACQRHLLANLGKSTEEVARRLMNKTPAQRAEVCCHV